MSKDTVERKNIPCANPRCGSTIYTRTYDFANDVMKPVWECCNCTQRTPRSTRHRTTNKGLAKNYWSMLKDEWKETDEQLKALVANGTPSGCMLLYSSGLEWNMNKLFNFGVGMDKEKLSTWAVKYHMCEARKQLQAAKDFVQLKQVPSV